MAPGVWKGEFSGKAHREERELFILNSSVFQRLMSSES